MLILPLEHAEPFAATLGTMLYPAMEEDDRRRAKAFASQWLAEPIRRAMEGQHPISDEVRAKLHSDSGVVLDDLQKRWRGGLWAGDLFKARFALAQSHPNLASLENALRIIELASTRAGTPGVRSSFMQAKRKFATVAHLWGAWSIREGKFIAQPELGYDGYADFQAFLTEAEILRDWGQNWHLDLAKAQPHLPAEVWRVPDNWEPLKHQDGWPVIGIPHLSIPDDLLASLRPVVGL